MDTDALHHVIQADPRLIIRPDGSLTHLCHVLDGTVFTQRMGRSTKGRTELRPTWALLPITTLVEDAPLPLVHGGQVECGQHPCQQALVGPPGWLPAVEPGQLLGFRLDGAALSVEPISDESLVEPFRQHDVRTLIHRHYRGEPCRCDEDGLSWRLDALLDAIAHALLDDSELFSTALPPLDELLQVGDTVNFLVMGMPMSLHGELAQRARKYGVTFDQYVIALLGQLAWRTPSAGDLVGPDDTTRAVLQLVTDSPPGGGGA